MLDFNEFLKVLKDNMEDLAQKSWKEYRKAAVKDGKRIPETPSLISWSLVWRPHGF